MGGHGLIVIGWEPLDVSAQRTFLRNARCQKEFARAMGSKPTRTVALPRALLRCDTDIVLAGLIVGASLLARGGSSFQILGYPGFAILCFTAAAAGSFWLVISIFVHDYQTRRKYPR